MAEFYVQVRKSLRMAYTSEEPFLYSTTMGSHQVEVCVYIYIHMFSNIRASSIRTKNERNKDYTNENNILSPNQTKSAVEHQRIIYTRKVQWLELWKGSYFKFWNQGRYTFGHANALSYKRTQTNGILTSKQKNTIKKYIQAVDACTCANAWLIHEQCTKRSVKQAFSTNTNTFWDAIAKFKHKATNKSNIQSNACSVDHEALNECSPMAELCVQVLPRTGFVLDLSWLVVASCIQCT